MSRKIWITLTITLLAALFLAGCVSLAEDITPPPNYRPPTQEAVQPVSASTVFPLVPPDPAQGAAIYAVKCAPCHGEAGLGDGPSAAGLSNPPAPIGKPEFARQFRPIDWFSVVTNGNMQKSMPPFTGSLNDRQRWDVVAYALTLSTTPEQLEQGKTAYNASCAACHGQTGKGDGPQAASQPTKPASWEDQSRLASLSVNDMVGVMTGAKSGHPTFSGTLDETKSYAVAAYIRSMSFAKSGDQSASAAQPTPGSETPAAGTPEAGAHPGATTPGAATPGVEGTPVEKNITLTGKLTNSTPGGKVPASGLKAHLQAYAGMSPAFDTTADVAPDGSYKFENVQFSSDYVYFVSVDVGDLTFNSDILHGSDITGAQADLPVKMYDTSTDTAALKIDRMHVFFDFTDPGQVKVVNLYIISNPTNKVITGKAKDGPVLSFELPKGYTNLQFQDGELGGRYVQTENGFGDRLGIDPGSGQHQILFAYDMAYANKLELAVKPPLNADAAIVMVPPTGVKLKSEQLTESGERSDVQGMSFLMYQSKGAIAAGQPINLSLSGTPGDASSTSGLGVNTYLLVGLGAFGLVLIGTGLWFYRQRKVTEDEESDAVVDETGQEPEETSDALLDAIMALDDLHANGKLPEAAYQERRADLKARLANVLEREKEGD